MHYKSISKEEWDKTLERLLLSYTIFATIENEFNIDYELIDHSNIDEISYNAAKPATPLKSFFLPVRENVSIDPFRLAQRIILGVPNCDIAGLKLLDEIYLDKDFEDPFYRQRRENTIIISADCFETTEHCHCLTYEIKPYSVSDADLAVIRLENTIILRIITPKGQEFLNQFSLLKDLDNPESISDINEKQRSAESYLMQSNKDLPDYRKTGGLVADSADNIWKKYSSGCVSCGACATICPTCSCFLLIDKPGFERIKQTDSCQYPGFERVAGGEDVLFEAWLRFKNRYMCKYVWKPARFTAAACTGCGRCIEACIGGINKNELFKELAI